nr:hemolysin family protein [uncultured Roseateles sp.]
MSLSASLLVILLLVATSAFFSVAEISMAAARRLKLRQLADEGDARAERVLQVQAHPGHYVAVVQIGLNAVAILGGIVGEGALTPHFEALFGLLMPAQAAATTGFVVSFLSITSFFILFADLCPKRLGMNQPEQMAMRVIGPMQVCMTVLKPVVWVFNGLVNGVFGLLGLPVQRDDSVTTDDIMAMAAAGTEAGVLGQQGQQVISNVFELETRTVESAMTSRERIVYLLQDDSEETIRTRIAAEPHSTYLVCDENIDEVVGYVDATDLFQLVLNNEPVDLRASHSHGLLKKVLMVPDRLTLSEVLLQFRQVHEDFAVIVNEYSLVVGVITLNDVMSTVMGDLVKSHDEEQIVRRDDGSWLIDGVTPIVDVMRACDIDELPLRGQYDTLAGFLMVMLRRIPRRTDTVTLAGLRFEVLDVDSYKIDQVMVTRLST